MERNNLKDLSNYQHDEYWMEPDDHALVQEVDNCVKYYSIYTLRPKLMMILCDDFEYAQRLSKKMIENEVCIFDNFSDLYCYVQTLR